MIFINGNYFQNPTFPTNKIDEERKIEVDISKTKDKDLFLNNKGAKIKVSISNQEKLLEGIIIGIKDNYLLIEDKLNDETIFINPKHINYITFIDKVKFD